MSSRQRVTGAQPQGPPEGGAPDKALCEGPPQQLEKRRRIFFKFACMAAAFMGALIGLVALYRSLPGLDGEARAELEAVLPSSFSEVNKLREVQTLRKLCSAVGVYRQQHPVALALLLSYLYLLYQAFPLFMFPFSGLAMAVTVLLGALYDSWLAFSLASLLSAVGPSLAYFLFKATGKPLVALLSARLPVRFFPGQLQRMRRFVYPTHSSSSSTSADLTEGYPLKAKEEAAAAETPLQQKEPQQQLDEQQQQQQQQQQRRKRCSMDVDLMLTILFLRVSPFPNLIINAASPVLDVPFGAFFVATWLGLMPNAALFGELLFRLLSGSRSDLTKECFAFDAIDGRTQEEGVLVLRMQFQSLSVCVSIYLPVLSMGSALGSIDSLSSGERAAATAAAAAATTPAAAAAAVMPVAVFFSSVTDQGRNQQEAAGSSSNSSNEALRQTLLQLLPLLLLRRSRSCCGLLLQRFAAVCFTAAGWRPLVVFVFGSAAVGAVKAGLRKLRPSQGLAAAPPESLAA
ncbi:hypothetical protein Efla_007150 [Eimeria flavescens]